MYLQHAFRLSDEAVVFRWIENPYYQHLAGETFFQHRMPIDPSSLTRWRKRIGEEGVEWLLTKTIEAGRASGAVTDKSLKRVAVDTTVMEKTIAQPSAPVLPVGVAHIRRAGVGRMRHIRMHSKMPDLACFSPPRPR